MSDAQTQASTSWRGRGTTKWLSETLKIQAVGAGFLAKSNLCSSEAELEGLFGSNVTCYPRVALESRKNVENCTKISLPCVKGGGPRSG